MENRRQLRNFLIEPNFQFRYIFLLMVMTFVPVMTTVSIITYFLRQNYMLLVNYATLDSEITSLLMWEFKFLVAVISIAFFLFFVAIFTVGIVFSHRIAGVIYKTRKTCKDIAEGKNVVLRFRDKDEFKELAEDFNSMIQVLRGEPKDRATA